MIWEQEILIKEAEARKEGREEGRKEGRGEEQKRMARSLKEQGVASEIILRCTDLSEDAIREL